MKGTQKGSYLHRAGINYKGDRCHILYQLCGITQNKGTQKGSYFHRAGKETVVTVVTYVQPFLEASSLSVPYLEGTQGDPTHTHTGFTRQMT